MTEKEQGRRVHFGQQGQGKSANINSFPKYQSYLGKLETLEDSDKVYVERNFMVLEKFRFYDILGIDVGWKQDDGVQGYDLLFIPDQHHDYFGHIGQMGWHYDSESLNPKNFHWIREQPFTQEFDGHDSIQKYRRMHRLDNKILQLIRDETSFEWVKRDVE